MIKTIGVIEGLKGFVVLDIDNKRTEFIDINTTKRFISKGTIKDLYISRDGQVKCKECGLSRFPVYSVENFKIKNDSKLGIFIIAEDNTVENKMYKVIVHDNKIVDVCQDEMIRYLSKNANVTLVNGMVKESKDNKKYISSIKGEFRKYKYRKEEKELKKADKNLKSDIKEELKLLNEIREKLDAASDAYYNSDTEIMSNFEYDTLYDKYKELEEKLGVDLKNSPTKKVGYEVKSKLDKIKHESKMLSLEKTKSREELKTFLNAKEGMLGLKLDGLTVVLTYENGMLKQGVTRGNGEIGEDITHNVKVFRNVPLSIGYKGKLVVRGEALISRKEFKRINECENERYKNPRNLTSGTVRQLDSKICADRNVSFVAFECVEGINKIKKSEKLEQLKELGFEIVYFVKVNKNNIEKEIENYEKMVSNYIYETDGLVLTFDEVAYSDSLESTSKAPKHSLAFKWKDETAETILRKIFWSPSRTGLINPVAIFDPVELEGTTVKQASVHNISIINQLRLGIGDTIRVYKANMIIPQVLESIQKSGNIKVPDTCPVCNQNTTVQTNKDCKVLVCTNPDCDAKNVGKIVHFCGRDAMNIEGMAEETVSKLIENGFITNVVSLFKLKDKESEFVLQEGLGKKSFDKLTDRINKAKDIELHRFIYGLGIEGIGRTASKDLVKHFDNKLDKIRKATKEELKGVNGFGDIMANNLFKFLNTNEGMINELITFIKFKEIETVKSNLNMTSEINGKTFVITGDVNHYKNRNELQNEIESLGGKVSNSVSSKTNYLINNDTMSSSGKNKKAKELGVKIISEEDFIKLKA